MRVSGSYVVWRGREYGSGGRDRQRLTTPISFYGPKPFEEGFEREKAEPRHRWPTWSRRVPLDEVDRRFKVRTVAVWRNAEFLVVSQSDDADEADSPDVLIQGPYKPVGEPKTFSWWLELPNLELLDRGLAYGWVPWSEVTDLREEVKEAPFPAP